MALRLSNIKNAAAINARGIKIGNENSDRKNGKNHNLKK